MQILIKVHRLYCDAASNPFYDPGMPLNSPKFAKDVNILATMARPPPPPQTAAI